MTNVTSQELDRLASLLASRMEGLLAEKTVYVSDRITHKDPTTDDLQLAASLGMAVAALSAESRARGGGAA